VIRREAGFSPGRTLRELRFKNNYEACYRHHPWEEAGDTGFIYVMRDGRESMDETVTRERRNDFFAPVSKERFFLEHSNHAILVIGELCAP
jgi:hypothetical protein